MMGRRVKVMKGNTFRLNVGVTPPYNADFDGDEVISRPQSIESVTELKLTRGNKINLSENKHHCYCSGYIIRD